MNTTDCHTDCELLALLKQDSRNAFELLYRRYWLPLYDTAFQRLKNSQQAEDIVQDIFVSLWIRRSTLQIDNLPAYLHTAVRFRVFNFVERGLAGEVFFEPFETIACNQSAPDSQLLEREMADLIQLYIKTLPEKRKQILLMHFSEGLGTREIAGQLQISQKTVQNQLGKAVKELRKHVAHSGMLFFLIYFH